MKTRSIRRIAPSDVQVAGTLGAVELSGQVSMNEAPASRSHDRTSSRAPPTISMRGNAGLAATRYAAGETCARGQGKARLSAFPRILSSSGPAAERRIGRQAEHAKKLPDVGPRQRP